MRFLCLTFVLLCTLSQGYAKEVLPVHCTPIVITQDALEIAKGKARILMIHNLLEVDVWLIQQDEDISTKVTPGLWSALAVDDTALEMTCVESRPGHEQQISCAEALGVCEWPITARPKDKSGVFFAAENMELAPIRAYLARIGFTLPQKS